MPVNKLNENVFFLSMAPSNKMWSRAVSDFILSFNWKHFAVLYCFGRSHTKILTQ